ncbi:glycosyltransferase family 4 protein [Paenibacillus phoenicis]|uniref:Glycosyltransferase family 4 protein n=1 Tax=Paenibacillus phoenicis TaxID=554117 RepID=A0ABU5PMX2_9BACL|nr:glycosyltransferase family 4 protein [Paenibacillus phoenicis]MEA3571280.1 glycosyltransferase family 4 protein [Paenibacillus phoenicis]
MISKLNRPIRIFVSDIQPIIPAISGGRLRLAGIWGNIPDGFEMNYVGTFDDKTHRKKTKKLLSKNATEILVPCSEEHFYHLSLLNAYFPGLTLFDVAFHRFAHFSKEYTATSIEYLKEADIIVFSHPWSYPLLKRFIDRDKQYVVYDAQNVESYLRKETLLKIQYREKGLELLQEIIQLEIDLVSNADLILACSQRDFEQFNMLYGANQSKIILAPNGVKIPNSNCSTALKRKFKKKWKLKRPHTVVFSGSNFEPNIKALQFINKIANNCQEIDFIITGDINNAILPEEKCDNVHLVGLLSQKKLDELLQMADAGLNPMESGSGSNVKIFTYMAASLPVITTPIGARGVDVAVEGIFEGNEVMVISSLEEFEDKLKLLLPDIERRQRIGENARKMVMLNYNWKEISKKVCQAMKLHFQL